MSEFYTPSFDPAYGVGHSFDLRANKTKQQRGQEALSLMIDAGAISPTPIAA